MLLENRPGWQSGNLAFSDVSKLCKSAEKIRWQNISGVSSPESDHTVTLAMLSEVFIPEPVKTWASLIMELFPHSTA